MRHSVKSICVLGVPVRSLADELEAVLVGLHVQVVELFV